MAEKNYYDVLGVKRDATHDEIKRSFRKLAAKFHPDAGGDEAKFKEVSEAYNTLSDEKKLREYDQMLMFGGPGFAGQGGGGRYTTNVDVDWSQLFNNVRGGDGAFGGFDFSSIFGGAGAGGTGGRRAPGVGGDLSMTIDVSFDEAFNGGTRKLTYRIPSTGESQTITVKIPAGAVDGGKLRHRGYGEYGTNGGQRGDLVVTTHVIDDPVFKRDGADVRMELPISIYEATLGATIQIPKPDGGKVRHKIPAGTQDGKTFRFRNAGAPDVKRRSGRGSLLVTVKVTVPTRLSSEERELLGKLRDSDTRDYRKDVESHG